MLCSCWNLLEHRPLAAHAVTFARSCWGALRRLSPFPGPSGWIMLHAAGCTSRSSSTSAWFLTSLQQLFWFDVFYSHTCMELRAEHVSHPYIFALLSHTPTILLAKWRSCPFFNQMYQSHLDLETWNLHRSFGMAPHWLLKWSSSLHSSKCIKIIKQDKASANLARTKKRVLRCSKSESAAALSPTGFGRANCVRNLHLKITVIGAKEDFQRRSNAKLLWLDDWTSILQLFNYKSQQFQDFQGFQFQLRLLDLWYHHELEYFCVKQFVRFASSPCW